MLNTTQISEIARFQIDNLIKKDYPKLARLTDKSFLDMVEPLIAKAQKLTVDSPDLESGYLPFVFVVKSDLVSTKDAMVKTDRLDRQGIIKLDPLNPEDFKTIDIVETPQSSVYLLADIDRGKESLNVKPKEALEDIIAKKRIPLTIDEGMAIVTQYPEFLRKNNCFSLAGSRHAGDKRVPAIWINGQKKINLGWCWDGNPHTWLGTASGGLRLGI